MKKLLYVLVAVLLMSCSDWLDVNSNPNSPTYVSSELLIPAAQASTAVTLGGWLFNNGGFYAQYWGQAPEANQYNAQDRQEVKAPYFDGVYTELLAGALNDYQVAINDAIKKNNSGDLLVATIMKAYTYQILIDILDKIPYTEAFLGNANPAPVWEGGEEVYAFLIDEIDAALQGVNQDPNPVITPNDLLLGSSVKKWVKFANNVKLKFYMRESYKTDRNKAKVQALIASEDNFLMEDVVFGVFADDDGKRNPWYETNVIGLGGKNHVATLPIISYLSGNGDPRIAKCFAKATGAGIFKGKIPGLKATGAKSADFSFPAIDKEQATCIMSLSELYLFIAEAQLRFNNNDGAAKQAYENAIDASFAYRGLDIEDAEDLYAVGAPYEWPSTTEEAKIERIGMEKWASLCMVNNWEAWTEIRRLGYPVVSTLDPKDIADDVTIYENIGERITPFSNSIPGNAMIERFLYPELAIIRNENTPTQVSLTDKVWWDVK